MSRIEHALDEVLAWLRPAWDVVARWAATLWHRAVELWCEVRDRHQRLMDTDPRYPVALATGGTAVVKVIITNPALAKAIGVLLADLLDVQDSPRAITRPDTYRDGPYAPRNSWSSGQLGSSLWDRDDWDAEE